MTGIDGRTEADTVIVALKPIKLLLLTRCGHSFACDQGLSQ